MYQNRIGPMTHTYTLSEETVIGEDYPTLYKKGTKFYFQNQWSMIDFVKKNIGNPPKNNS